MPTGYLGEHQEARVFAARRPQMKDEAILELVRPDPHFGGPWPASLANVPITAELRRRLDKYQKDQPMPGDEYVNRMLELLARLRKCLDDAGVKGPGAVLTGLEYDIDQTTHLGRGSAVFVEASSLPENEDAPFYQCVVSAHLGYTMRFLDSYDLPGHVISGPITVPVTNDSFYRALFGGRS
jgi:hypothetical protein